MPDDTTAPQGSTPVPDPTALTDKAIAKAVASLTDYVDSRLTIRDERLTGVDSANSVRFDGIQTQFRERDARADRESQLNKVALDAAFSASKAATAAAFAAQKEDANRRDEANGKAIDKSERATAETIKTNQELGSTRLDALAKTLDEVKIQVSRIESTKVGATENRTGIYATIGIISTIFFLAMGVLAFVATQGPR